MISIVAMIIIIITRSPKRVGCTMNSYIRGQSVMCPGETASLTTEHLLPHCPLQDGPRSATCARNHTHEKEAVWWPGGAEEDSGIREGHWGWRLKEAIDNDNEISYHAANQVNVCLASTSARLWDVYQYQISPQSISHSIIKFAHVGQTVTALTESYQCNDLSNFEITGWPVVPYAGSIASNAGNHKVLSSSYTLSLANMGWYLK